MFGLIENLAKAAVSVAVAPVALVVDVVKLPATAYDNKPAFGNTQRMLSNAGDCFNEATRPKRG